MTMHHCLTRLVELDGISRIAFRACNGVHHEGYPLDADGTCLVWGEGGPLAPEEPLRIPYAAIDLDSFSGWDTTERRWRALHWDAKRGAWSLQ
ncbi:MAG: hypothetical protein HY696_04200 [Deltaproteobacteria bacterium]|nr:hypothetical protein [Deltaproteobacteria bacterium]